MAKLKAATATAHERTEAAMPSERLLDGTLDIEGYAELLAKQFTAYDSLENHLGNHLPSHPAFFHFFQKKSPWLLADLRDLGAESPPEADVHHPLIELPHLVGMMYVLEGSMLGGQVILRALWKNENLAHLPHHFYNGHGKNTGKRWREFGKLVEQNVNESEMEKAILGARYAFDFFQNTMN